MLGEPVLVEKSIILEFVFEFLEVFRKPKNAEIAGAVVTAVERYALAHEALPV